MIEKDDDDVYKTTWDIYDLNTFAEDDNNV